MPLAGIGDGKASPIASFEDEDVLLATYSNAAQGFSLLVDAGSFTVTEGQGAGATFVLNTDASSYFAVSYVADWEGTPDVGEYLEEQLLHGQMEHGDSYVQVSADGGEIIYLAGVGAYACAYGYVDSSTGQNMTVIQAMEPRSDGAPCIGRCARATSLPSKSQRRSSGLRLPSAWARTPIRAATCGVSPPI